MANSLIDKTVLVRMTTHFWHAMRKDKKVSAEIAATHNSDYRMGHYNKRLIDHPSLKKVRSEIGAAVVTHYHLTLPWWDQGVRILPAALLFDYQEKLRKHKIAVDEAADEFVQDYPAAYEEAKKRLNGLFDPNDYPPVEVIRQKFGIEFLFIPTPSPDDWRIKLGAEQECDMKRQIEESLEQAQRSAMRDVWSRLYSVVEHVADRLSDPETIFRNSMVENVQELLDILPQLNVSNDDTLTKMAEDVRLKIAAYDPDDFRKDTKLRSRTAKAAKDLLKKMEAFA